MDGIIKSTPVRLLFVLVTLVVTVTICQQAFAQYQYGEGQARIIFSSSNSTHATISSSSPNIVITSNGYSNSTHITVPFSSPSPALSFNAYSNTTHSIVTPQSTSAVPEFGSIAPIILAISVIAIVVLNAKTRFFNTSHSGGI